MTCREHTWNEIYRHTKWDCEKIIRWCDLCGAVVVDTQVDNRTMKGRPYIPTGNKQSDTDNRRADS